MPRQTRYLLQSLAQKGASWKTVQKSLNERDVVYFGDQLARTTDAWELRVTKGATTVEHWLLRDKPAAAKGAQ